MRARRALAQGRYDRTARLAKQYDQYEPLPGLHVNGKLTLGEVWSDSLTRRIVLSNPHSPSAYRVNGVVRNDAGWYAAFPQIRPGDAYYLAPGERVTLW